jgi:hypothetical protein
MVQALLAVLAAASPAPLPSPSPSSDPCAGMIAIVTRPTVTSSVCTVRYGHALLENGYTNTATTGRGGGQTVNYAQSLARVGIGDNVGIYYTLPSYERSSAGGVLASGWSDANAGLKWVDEHGSPFLWGLQAQYSFPTGSPPFTNGVTQVSGFFNWSYQLSSQWSTGGTIGYTTQINTLVPSIVVTRALSPATQGYAEYAYFSHAAFGLPGKSLIDFGYSAGVTPQVQFDVEYGLELTTIEGRRQRYVGAGLSFME